MHMVLRNAISTMNYLMLLQSTGKEEFPECVIDELKLYTDGLNDLFSRDDNKLMGLKEEIKDIVKEELYEGTYLDVGTPMVKEQIDGFYKENNFEEDPSLQWYFNILDEIEAEQTYEKG